MFSLDGPQSEAMDGTASVRVVYVYCSKTVPGCFTLIFDRAPPVACNDCAVARALSRRCYPHTVNAGLVGVDE